VPFDGAQVSVEVRGSRLRVIRMAGVFDPTTATRVASVAGAQLAHCSGHIVLDLGEVRFFGTDDVAALVALEDAAAAVGLRLHITGLAGRESLLPSGVSLALARFSMFPTVEHAERELVGRVPLAAPGSAPRSRYVWSCPPLTTESGRAASRPGPLRSA
jgi:anti-anti-sigma regulatory factor